MSERLMAAAYYVVGAAMIGLAMLVVIQMGKEWRPPTAPKRMQKIPCAKGVPCREIVVDTAWMQVVEVKP